jgi:hypothetical protein
MPNLLIPAKTQHKPKKFIEFLHSLKGLDEETFKEELRKMIKEQPNLKTFFRLKKIDMDRFLKESKHFVFEYLSENQRQANQFFAPPAMHLTGTYSNNTDSLILQWGNIQHSFSNASTGLTGNTGSRLILGTVVNPVETTLNPPDSTYHSSPSYACRKNDDQSWNRAKYYPVDCTKTVNFNFTTNLKYSAPGVVTAVYLVPMGKYITDKGDNVTLDDFKYYGPNGQNANTAFYHLINEQGFNTVDMLKSIVDEYGFGYCDAQGLGQCSSVEIDIAEMTPNSFSLTLHGIIPGSEGLYDTAGSQINVHNFRGYPVPNEKCKLFRKVSGSEDFVLITEYPAWDTYGPSSKFSINTMFPFEIDATLNYNNPSPDDLTVTVILSQNDVQLKLVVSSEGGAFPKSERMESMNVVVSNWAISGDATRQEYYSASTWWLDGFNIRDSETVDYRGWTKQSNYQMDGESDTVGASQNAVAQTLTSVLDSLSVPSYYRNYDYVFQMAADINVGNMSLVKNNKVCFSGIFNFQIWVGENRTLTSTTTLPVWIMDAVYRGYIQQNNPNPDTSIYFMGEYESNYGVIYDTPTTDCLMTTTVGDINTLSSGYVNKGHDFFNYQVTSAVNPYDKYKAAANYSLGNYYFRATSGGSRYKRIPDKEKGVMKERIDAIGKGGQSYEYSILKQSPYYIAELGISFLDAPGVMLNGAIF